jgi:ubiquitin carboxyl-terminal hydrolase 14
METKRAKLGSTEDETTTAAAAEPDAVSMDVEGSGASAATATAAAAAATGGDEEDEDAAMAAALAMSLGDTGAAAATTVAAPVFGPGIPDSFTGDYELMGVVTHKGRDADSGHYIGWVRQEPGSSFWWKCDDDKVSEVKTEEILALKGGGDWHTAYLSFYRYKA